MIDPRAMRSFISLTVVMRFKLALESLAFPLVVTTFVSDTLKVNMIFSSCLDKVDDKDLHANLLFLLMMDLMSLLEWISCPIIMPHYIVGTRKSSYTFL